ncbi:MAG: UTP--glucose-1-phosphate uridylyltransferase, partial [Planctomycetota bacterium]
AIEGATGRILLNSPSELALSPDGHGGLVTALDRAGFLDEMSRLGIRHVFYHQVDNPTVIIADPAFLGFHVLERSQMSTNVVRKTSPIERMGVLVDIEGRTEIIEYSELTADQSAKTDESGQWIFWAGNTAIHLFDLDFLRRLAENGCQLPLHAARKTVSGINSDGSMADSAASSSPNAIKMERFIFDALPLAENTLIFEGDRNREFNPVKNESGADSPETCRAALNRIAHEWLAEAGAALDPNLCVEISPLQALDAAELTLKLKQGCLVVNDLITSQQSAEQHDAGGKRSS